MGNTQKNKYIDIFAGCGGLSFGLHSAGWQGVFAIEKNLDAFTTLKHNLIDSIHHFDWPDWLPQTPHDINNILKQYKVELSQLNRKIDLVVDGPLYQGFSIAGRRNENDQRNKSIKSYIQFIRIIQPKIFFFENVKGFTLEFKKNKDKEKEYSSYVENALKKAGYYVKGELINFGDYGIPQKRTRFILVGIRKDINQVSKKTVEIFFSIIKENRYSFLSSKDININTNIEDAISDLLRLNGEKDSPDTKHFKSSVYSAIKTPYQKLMRTGITQEILDSHRFPRHRTDIVNKFQIILYTCKKNKEIDSQTRERFNIKKHTIIPLDAKDKSPTITTLPDDYIHYCEPRILTVREYARIQSFPDWYHFKGKYTTSGKRRTKEVPRYSQIGNAIPPLFGEQAGITLKILLNNDRG